MTRPRLRLGGLELSVIDPHARDTEYIFGEVFEDRVYAHPRLRLAEGGTIVDVGANIGLSTIWLSREHRPRAILAYEASPTTHAVLVDNVARCVDANVTRVDTVNLAVSRQAGAVLELHQPPYGSGLSTLLDGATLPWIDELRAKGELHTHEVTTTTISAEIAARGLDCIDLLKIDVEGHFMEVLDGIAPADRPRVRNLVLEAEYAETLGHSADSICAMLRGWGFEAEAKPAAQIMVYAWRD